MPLAPSTIAKTAFSYLYDLGANDLSRRPTTPQLPARPQYFVINHIFAKRGLSGPVQVAPNRLDDFYGTESFDPKGVYFTHTSLHTLAIAAKSSTQSVNRVRPDDAVDATGVLWLGLKQDIFPEYERAPSGAYVVDQLGAPVPTGQNIQGYTVKLTWEKRANNTAFGQLQPVLGSGGYDMYPVLEVPALSFGKDYGNDGISLWLPTLTDQDGPDQ